MNTKVVHIGNKVIGGGNPILIQSMCNTKTQDVAATVAQIHELEKAGCDIIRVACPDMDAAKAIGEIKPEVIFAPDPVVASECHIDHLSVGEAARRLAFFAPFKEIMEAHGAETAPLEAIA